MFGGQELFIFILRHFSITAIRIKNLVWESYIPHPNYKIAHCLAKRICTADRSNHSDANLRTSIQIFSRVLQQEAFNSPIVRQPQNSTESTANTPGAQQVNSSRKIHTSYSQLWHEHGDALRLNAAESSGEWRQKSPLRRWMLWTIWLMVGIISNFWRHRRCTFMV